MAVSSLSDSLWSSLGKQQSSGLSGMSSEMAKALSSLGASSARASFEVQFNQLQNQVIERLNQKLTEIQNENTAARQIEQISYQHKRQVATYKELETVRSQLSPNVFAVRDTIAAIDRGAKAIATDSTLTEAEQKAAYTAAIKDANNGTNALRRVDGWRVGLNNTDGTETLKATGIIQIDGKTIESFDDIQAFVDRENIRIEAANAQAKQDFKAANYPSLTDDEFDALLASDGTVKAKLDALQTEKLDAMEVARKSLQAATIGGSSADGTLPKGMTAVNMMAVDSRIGARADALVNLIDKTKTSIQKLEVEKAAVETADLADKAGRAAKIRQEYGIMLESVSMAFEGSQSMVESIASQFFNSGNTDRGSVVSLFS